MIFFKIIPHVPSKTTTIKTTGAMVGKTGPLRHMRAQLLQLGQAFFSGGIAWMRLGQILVDAAGLLVFADRLVGLAEHVVGVEVAAINGDELLQSSHRLFDLVGFKVVARDDLLVLGGFTGAAN